MLPAPRAAARTKPEMIILFSSKNDRKNAALLNAAMCHSNTMPLL
jgi:hypothetical protein